MQRPVRGIPSGSHLAPMPFTRCRAMERPRRVPAKVRDRVRFLRLKPSKDLRGCETTEKSHPLHRLRRLRETR